MTPGALRIASPAIEEAVIKHELHVDALRPIRRARRARILKHRVRLGDLVVEKHAVQGLPLPEVARGSGYSLRQIARAWAWVQRAM